jgi:6-phosphogluconolactonase/glucosamine-6-phosphate isomerase/deaminase
MAIIKTYPDAKTLTREAALHFITCANEAIAERNLFSVALAGGSTPNALYEALATVELVPRVDWEKVHVFWGDERCVAPITKKVIIAWPMMRCYVISLSPSNKFTAWRASWNQKRLRKLMRAA